MNELKIIEYQNQRVLLTSQLAESYGTTARRISENYSDNKERYVEGKHYYCLENKLLKDFKKEYGNSVVASTVNKLYVWTERGAFLHAKSLNTDKAWEIYDSLVEHYFKSREAKPSMLPTTYKEALLQLVAQVEQNEKLELENQELKPKAQFADAVATSKTSILVGDLAKIIKSNGYDVGQKRLFEWLRINGYLIKRKGSDWNMPTQKSMELGLFEIKESVHLDSNGCNVTKKTSKVTGKGQIYFVNKFIKLKEEAKLIYF